jgi:hypothetical protein
MEFPVSTIISISILRVRVVNLYRIPCLNSKPVPCQSCQSICISLSHLCYYRPILL